MTDLDRGVSFGVKTSQLGLGYDEILRIWREADQLPVFAHAWLWDHLVPLRGPVNAPALEAWTLLAALAAQTRRLRLGVMVTSNRLRSPALLARMAATVDVIAGGRLDLGIGAGGSRLPAGAENSAVNPAVREFEAFGVPLVPPGQAVVELAEACTVIRRMWTETAPFDHDGPALRLRGAVCEPKPVQRPHPPILVAGSGDRLLRVVAEHADIWNYPGSPAPGPFPVHEFRDREAVLLRHCGEIGRDPAEIVRSMQVIVHADAPDGPRGVVAARDALLRRFEAGITHLVLAPVLDGRPLSWVVEQIVEPVRAQIDV